MTANEKARWAEERNKDWRAVRDELAQLPGSITLSQLAKMLPVLPEWESRVRSLS